MATYLHEEEGVYNYSFDSFSSKTVAFTMAKMGYPEQLARVPTHFSKRYDGYMVRVPNALKALKVHALVRTHIPLPPNLALSIKMTTVRVYGPVTLEYTAIAEPLPLMRRVSVTDSKDLSGKFYHACTLAKIELFHDKSLHGFYATRAWARLRILDLTLLPQKIEETIATTNPSVLNSKDHMLHQCFGSFWTRGYVTAQQIGRNREMCMVYCREHDRYEELKFQSSVPLLQLGAGLMNEEGWTLMVIHQGKGKLPDEIEGSHGCGNGLADGDPHADSVGCVGIFCVRWEKKTYNGQRKDCHARSDAIDEEDDDEEVECICIPGLDIPCILGRTHITHTELQRQFLANFNQNNPYGGCPFCSKEFIVDTGLSGFLKDANLNVLIKHMNLNHSTSMALL